MSRSTSIKLRAGLKERVEALAEGDRQTPNRIMNDAIAEYVERRERRQKYLAEVAERYREYRETGLHVSQDEADEWIEALLAGEDPPLPPSHH